MKKTIIKLVILTLILTSCGVRYYKPTVMPAGVSKLKRKPDRKYFPVFPPPPLKTMKKSY